jgi:nucleoside-diphosphate-sugar epimerase
MVVGPQDPTLAEGMATLARLVRGRLPLLPPGGLEMVDVRDVALVHAAALVPGRGPRRYVVNGHHVTTGELVERLQALTGRRIRCWAIPLRLARAGARLGEVVQRVVPLGVPMGAESIEQLTTDPRTDDARTRAELGVVPRALESTLADTLLWMAGAGVIAPAHAGALAPR